MCLQWVCTKLRACHIWVSRSGDEINMLPSSTVWAEHVSLTPSQCEARNQRRQQPAAAWHFMIISTISTREYLLCSLFSQHQPVSALLTDFVIQMFYLSFGIRMERLEEQQQQSSFSRHRLHQHAEILIYNANFPDNCCREEELWMMWWWGNIKGFSPCVALLLYSELENVKVLCKTDESSWCQIVSRDAPCSGSSARWCRDWKPPWVHWIIQIFLRSLSHNELPANLS